MKQEVWCVLEITTTSRERGLPIGSGGAGQIAILPGEVLQEPDRSELAGTAAKFSLTLILQYALLEVSYTIAVRSRLFSFESSVETVMDLSCGQFSAHLDELLIVVFRF
jgi:hypothetical protein